MDPDALATANQLVGNPLDACGLEFTGMGPTLFFPQALCLAWTGGMMPATMTVANKAKAIAVSLPSHRPVVVPAGATVRWGACLAGFRCWLALGGGIDAPLLLASRSSHLAAVIGGTPLRKDDQLTLGSPSNRTQRLQSVIRSRLQPFQGDTLRSSAKKIRSGCLRRCGPYRRVAIARDYRSVVSASRRCFLIF